jgi:hypothetical protein
MRDLSKPITRAEWEENRKNPGPEIPCPTGPELVEALLRRFGVATSEEMNASRNLSVDTGNARRTLTITLAPDVFYPEEDLIAGLAVSRKWLRRKVGGLRAGRARVYRGADVLEKMQVCPRDSPSVSTPAPVHRFGMRAVSSKVEETRQSAGPPGSASIAKAESVAPVAWLKEEQRKPQNSVLPLSASKPRVRRTRPSEK